MTKKTVYIFFIFVCAFIGFGGAVLQAAEDSSHETTPFWRTKTKVLKKITDERAIIVSVKSVKTGEGSRLLMSGGGLVKLPMEKVFVETQKYENLKRVSDHVREVDYRASKKELYLHTEAYSYHARMTMVLTPQNIDEKYRRIHFKIVRGNFLGMEGAFTFENYKPEATLMGFQAQYDYKKLPMPQFFVEFGLEFVLQKVAGLMRRYLEKESRL